MPQTSGEVSFARADGQFHYCRCGRPTRFAERQPLTRASGQPARRCAVPSLLRDFFTDRTDSPSWLMPSSRGLPAARPEIPHPLSGQDGLWQTSAATAAFSFYEFIAIIL